MIRLVQKLFLNPNVCGDSIGGGGRTKSISSARPELGGSINMHALRRKLRRLPSGLLLPFALVFLLVNSIVTHHVLTLPEFPSAHLSDYDEERITTAVLHDEPRRNTIEQPPEENELSIKTNDIIVPIKELVAKAQILIEDVETVEVEDEPKDEAEGEESVAIVELEDFTQCTSPERSVEWPLSGDALSRTSDLTCGLDSDSEFTRYLREQTLPRLAELKDECKDLVVYGVAFGSQHRQLLSSIYADRLDSSTMLNNHGRCFFVFVLEEDMPETSMISHTWLIPIPRAVLPYKNLRRNTKLLKYHGHFLFPYAQLIVWQDAKFFKRVYVRAQPLDYRETNTGACVTAMTLPVHPNTFGATNLDEAKSQAGTSEQWRYDPKYIHHCETILDALEKRPDVTDSSETLMLQCYAYATYMKEREEEIGTSPQSIFANSTLTLDQGLIDSAYLVWNYATEECRNFNAELQCTLSDQLQCHSDRDQVSFPFAMAQMGLKVKEGTEDRLDRRTNHLQLTQNGESNDEANTILVHMTKSACHWYFRPLGNCAEADRPSLAIVVAGSTKRLQFESTLRHLIEPVAKTQQYNVDYYAMLVESEAPAFRQDTEYMNHIIEEKMFRPKRSQRFLDGKGVARTMIEKVEEVGGNLRGIDLRKQPLPIHARELKRKRETARRRYRKQDVDLRFPMYDMRVKHRERVANGNRNILNLFNGLQNLWDTTLLPFENSVGKQYDYVMILRDDAMWLHDFDMNALLSVPQTTNSTTDAYVLSCDAREPAMATQETNDHIIVLKRAKAAVIGRYLSTLLSSDLQSCHKQAGFIPALDRGCNSEMILTWILQENNITVQKVPQSVLPFERSLTIRKPNGIEEHCFHKFCQSHASPIEIPVGMRTCTSVDFS